MHTAATCSSRSLSPVGRGARSALGYDVMSFQRLAGRRRRDPVTPNGVMTASAYATACKARADRGIRYRYGLCEGAEPP
jgi:hypothetical protein